MTYYIVPIGFIGIVLLVGIYRRRSQSSTRANISQAFLATNSSYGAKKRLYPNLSEEQRIELSWRFLYEITDYVLNKFSKEDIKAVTEIGRKLIKFGMSYQHVIEYGIISQDKSKAKVIEERESTAPKQTSI